MTHQGHNGGPSLEPLTDKVKITRIRTLLAREDLSSLQKCVGIALTVNAEKDGQVNVTTRELQRYASTKRKETVFQATRALADAQIIQKQSGRGEAGRYRILSASVIQSVIDAYTDRKTGTEKPHHTHEEPVRKNRTTSPQTGTPEPDQSYAASGAEKPYHSEPQPVRSNRTGTEKPDRFDRTGTVEPDQSPSRARANKESPTEISLSQERETRTPAPARDVPHMNGVGFVISQQHDLVIPMDVLAGWRQQFPAIRNLEARLQKHSSYILRGGYMHPGWQCPEGWIAGLLDEDNAKAESDAKIAEAKVARAENGGSKPSIPSYMRR